MEEQRGEDDRPEAESAKPAEERNNWGRQIMGALIGGAVVLILGTIAQQFGWLGPSLTRYVMWGSVVGALIGSADALERAGQRLTRRDEPWLNIAVSLIGMAVAFAFIFAISRAMLVLTRLFD